MDQPLSISEQASPQLRILGTSPWATQIGLEVARIAPHSSTVLITGPTGTGKELVAGVLHAKSNRAAYPFIPVDCSSISGPLCASQLFGHVKGAFTGADYEVLGCFRAAEGGTIFLDEVGELEPSIQTMLLRVIQERTVSPVGSHDEVPIDVRIVAATNRVLEHDVHDGRFREDLYYRLSVVRLETVPLNERLEDIEILARHFLGQFAEREGVPPKSLSPEGLIELCAYDWPGNVRELQNVLERAAVFADADSIGPGALDLRHATYRPSSEPPSPSPVIPPGEPPCTAETWATLADHEAQHIARTLELTGYNQSAAARLLNINRHLLARKMKKYGLRKPTDAS